MTLLINGTFAPLVLQSLGMMATVEEHQLGGVQGFIGFRDAGVTGVIEVHNTGFIGVIRLLA